MSELDLAKSVLLGVIQGLTEFLPISSSAHLALAQRWLGLDPDSPSMLLFDILAHVGTLLAVAYVFATTISRFARRLFIETKADGFHKRYAWRTLGLAMLACVPTAYIGFSFQTTLEAAFDKPQWIGAGLVLTGVLLVMTMLPNRPTRGWRKFRWWQALLVGIAQGLAILPGISRSGSTICVALLCGLRRRWTAEFSFLIAVPPIVGGAALKIQETLDASVHAPGHPDWRVLIVGAVVSTIVGIFALRCLLRVVSRAKLHYFAIYCWLLGGMILAGVLRF